MDGQRVGYVRVSSFDQNPDRQLEAVSVARTFIDKASGKDTRRPELDRLLAFVRDTSSHLPARLPPAALLPTRSECRSVIWRVSLCSPGPEYINDATSGCSASMFMTGALRGQRLRSSRQWASRRVSCRRVSRRRSVDQHLMLPSYQPRNPPVGSGSQCDAVALLPLFSKGHACGRHNLNVGPNFDDVSLTDFCSRLFRVVKGVYPCLL